MKISLKDIAFNGIIAALYVVLTLVTYPISFLGIQFRFAEILLLLVFFRRDLTIGLTVGCFLANLFSPIGLIDAAFGTAATLLSCLVLMFCKHLLVGCFAPIIFNAGLVGLELSLFIDGADPFWINAGLVAIGEAVVIGIGYALFMIFRRNQNFYKLIQAKRNIDFKL